MNTIYKVCGGRWGGTKVDESFLKLLDQVIGSEKKWNTSKTKAGQNSWNFCEDLS